MIVSGTNIVRIISGDHKGRRLVGLASGNGARGQKKGGGMRPTSARVKEAIFNILPNNMEGVHVLDLFAGTGGLGIEALSRGAERAVFVDSSRPAFRAIQQNLRVTGLKDRAELFSKKVSSATVELAGRGESFELIFLDPPYRKTEDLDHAIKHVYQKDLLSPEGIMVIEHSAGYECTIPENWKCLRSQKYGDTAVTFVTNSGGENL